ncbi:MAG: carboxypeptidase regulatory-like domain-containing protein [Bacteroidia bacterium]|nr:carboxypeptidase regulatory-like domain-containing protein [Bacteroidia bacterium]
MKTLLKKIAAGILVIIAPAFGIAGGEIRGKITEPNGEPARGAIVKALSGTHEIAGTATDADGKYVIKPLEAGKYDVVITYPQYKMQKIENVEVLNEEAAYVDAVLNVFGLDKEVIVVGKYKRPPLDRTEITMHVLDGQTLNRMPIQKGDIKGAITAVSSDIYQDPHDGELYLRGSRKGSSTYFIDGEKMLGNIEVPALAIKSITAITGGIPAQYGDLTGGAIIVTTQDYFGGMSEKTAWKNAR